MQVTVNGKSYVIKLDKVLEGKRNIERITVYYSYESTQNEAYEAMEKLKGEGTTKNVIWQVMFTDDPEALK